MRAVIEHPETAWAVGADLRARAVERFSVERMCAGVGALYHRLIDR